MSLRNKIIDKKFVSVNNKDDGWQSAITAAENLLLRIQVRERKVAAVVKIFKEKMEAGEPWPGSFELAGVDEELTPAKG